VERAPLKELLVPLVLLLLVLARPVLQKLPEVKLQRVQIKYSRRYARKRTHLVFKTAFEEALKKKEPTIYMSYFMFQIRYFGY
jgi:hypothetical protein